MTVTLTYSNVVSKFMTGLPLDLDFTASDVLDPRITFSRASLGTYYDSAGVLKYAANNWLWPSEDYTHGNWNLVNGATVTANAAAAPDATTTAARLNHVTAGTVSAGLLSNGLNTGFPATVVSVYVKAGTKSWVALRNNSVGANGGVWFNLATGVIGTIGTNWASAGIQSVGGGWYRCYGVTGPTGAFRIIVAEADNSYTCTSPGDIYFWHPQAEVSTETTPRAYLPTTTAAVHGPRFDYDPVSHAPRGLLIEEARQNMLSTSSEFSIGIYTKTGVTVTVDQTVAPDGTTTADRLTATATTAIMYATTSIGGTVAYTCSVFAKKGTSDWFYLEGEITLPTETPRAYFNLATGVIGTVDAGISSAVMQDVGNGWYRCSITRLTSSSGGVEFWEMGICDANGSPTVTIGKTIFLWGAQAESSAALMSSYIPTAGALATRAADVPVMTGTAFSSWYNQAQGTFVCDFDLLGDAVAGAARGLISADGGSVSESVRMLYNTTPMLTFSVVDGGATQADTLHSPPGAGALHKFGACYALNDFASCADGGTVLTDVVGTLPTPTQLRIGADEAAHYLNGHVRRIRYWNYAVTDAALVTLTAPSVAPVAWNPADKSASVNLTNSDKTATSAASGYRGVRGTGPKTTGKVHVEFRYATSASPNWGFGIGNAAAIFTNYIGVSSDSIGIFPGGNVYGNVGYLGAGLPSGGTTSAGTWYALEIDFDAKTLKFGTASAWGPPFSFSFLTGPYLLLWTSDTSGNNVEINTGQSAFVITPNTGFEAGWTA